MMMEDSFVRGPSGSIRGNRNQVSKSVQRIAMSSSPSSTSSPTASLYFSSQSSSDSESDLHPLSSNSSFTLINELLKFSSQSSMDLSNIGSDSYSNSSDEVIHSLKKKGIMRKCKSVKFIPAICNDDGHEKNQVVLYSTSIGVIRSTFEACNKLRAILDQNFIPFEERDLFLDESFRYELQNRVKEGEGIKVPCVFFKGFYIGGMEEIEALNESGFLRRILPTDLLASSKQEDQPEEHGVEVQDKDQRDHDKNEGNDGTNSKTVGTIKKFPLGSPPKKKVVCGGCGGARFIPCTRCHGSTKSCVLRFPHISNASSSSSSSNHTSSKIVSLKCSLCSRGTGLIRCPLCFSSSSSSSSTGASIVLNLTQDSSTASPSLTASLTSSGLKRNLGNSIRKGSMSSSLLSLSTSSLYSSSAASSCLPSPSSYSSGHE